MFRRRKIKDEDFKNDPNTEEDFASLWDSDIKVKKKRVRRTKRSEEHTSELQSLRWP